MVLFEAHHYCTQLRCELLCTPRPKHDEEFGLWYKRQKVGSELQFAALRMSAVDTSAALALKVAAPRVEWVEKIEVSTPESATTLFIHLPMVHGFTGVYGFLTEIKRGLVAPAYLIS